VALTQKHVRGAGEQFERAEFATDEGLALERVVLLGVQQLPGQAGEFASGRDDCDLRATASTDALIERARRTKVLIADQAASTSRCRALEDPCLEMRSWGAGLSPDCRTRGSTPR
jgi:hypothetical protein